MRALAAAAVLVLVPLPASALPLCLGNCNCSVSATPMNFGVYDPLGAGAVLTTSQVTVTCQVTNTLGIIGAQVQVNYEVGLSGGASGNPAARSMTSALGYGLYLDAARTIPWGDGSNGSEVIRGSYVLLTTPPQTLSTTYTVYGRLPARQAAMVGAYTDAIAVTLTY